MTSLQRDPRKQYVLDKRNCKDLSITQKLYHPECRKEATVERPINPKPKPPIPPRPPKRKPSVPDLPPEPSVPYSFTVAGNFNYSPMTNPSVNPYVLAGAGVAGVASAFVAERALYRLQSKKNIGFRRVPTTEPETTLDDIEFRGGEGEGTEMRETRTGRGAPKPSAREAGRGLSDIQRERVSNPTSRSLQTEQNLGRSTSIRTPDESGLRNRRGLNVRGSSTADDIEPMEEVPLDEPPPRPAQSRIPRPSRIFPRANPPSRPPPTAPERLTELPTAQSATELTEAEASRAQLTSDLDDIINENKAAQASLTQAEAAQTEVAQTEAAETAEAGEVTATEGELAATQTAAAEGTELSEIAATQGEAAATTAAADAGAEGAATTAEIGTQTAATETVATGTDAAATADLAPEGGFAAMESTVGEAAGATDLAGAGPEDIFADAAAGAVAVFGTIGAGIASLFGGGKPPEYNNISGTAVMSKSDIQNAITKVKAKVATETRGTATYNSLLALQNSLTNTLTLPKPVAVSYKNAQGNPDIAVPLSNSQLATAIKVYQQNPNAYMGMSATKLQVMGLSPQMAKGEAGSTLSSIGYIPKLDPTGVKAWTTGAGGGNWTGYYTVNQNAFTSNANMGSLAVPDAAQQKTMNDNYIAQVTGIINKESDPAVKAYLNYELDMFRYNNGYIPNPPTPVPKPAVTSAQQAQMTQLTDAINNKKASLAAIQNSINTKTSAVAGINKVIAGIHAQNQARAASEYQNQLASYQTQVFAYNQQVAQNIGIAEGQTASYNIAYARATNTPLLAPSGKYLTPAQRQSFQTQLASGQIKTTGVNPITTVAPTGITTSASGSPIVNQNALQTVPSPSATTTPVAIGVGV